MCGAVHYTIAEKPLVAGLCHCNRCRPQSGSAFSTVIFIHRSALTITGETAVFEDLGTEKSCAAIALAAVRRSPLSPT